MTSTYEKLQSETLTGMEVLRERTVGTKMRKKVSMAISGLLLSENKCSPHYDIAVAA